MARGFRKRVKISKGVHLNVSKSGVGLSVGGKGLTVSTGKTWNIPKYKHSRNGYIFQNEIRQQFK